MELVCDARRGRGSQLLEDVLSLMTMTLHVDGGPMDMGTALVTVVAAGLVLMPRVPALTAEGRAKSRIRSDVDLWASMPKGDARDALAKNIESNTARLLTERARDRRIESTLIFSWSSLAGGWAALVFSEAILGKELWWGQVRLALQMIGLAAGLIGLFAFLLVVAQMIGGRVLKVRTWWRSRRRDVRRAGITESHTAPEPGTEI